MTGADYSFYAAADARSRELAVPPIAIDLMDDNVIPPDAEVYEKMVLSKLCVFFQALCLIESHFVGH
jgi:hypothetical protein